MTGLLMPIACATVVIETMPAHYGFSSELRSAMVVSYE
jgi:hypothetical protein